MYCPRCGKQHTGNDVRFCSGCGFQLGGVTDLLANHGFLPHQLPPVVLPPAKPPRKKGVKAGAILMFISAVLLPIFFVLAVAEAEHPGPLLVPLTIFLAGLSCFLYSKIFGEDTALPPKQIYPQQFGGYPPRTALPGVENFRVTGMAPQRANTSEIVEPPNVTDHTTQLFDKE